MADSLFGVVPTIADTTHVLTFHHSGAYRNRGGQGAMAPPLFDEVLDYYYFRAVTKLEKIYRGKSLWPPPTYSDLPTSLGYTLTPPILTFLCPCLYTNSSMHISWLSS